MAAARSAAGGAGVRLEDHQAAGLALDADALDQIADLLRSRVWCAALVPVVAEMVRATGRAVDGVEE